MSCIPQIDIDSLVKLEAPFTVAGSHAPIDPDQVRVFYTNPDGEETTKTYPADTEIVRDGVGLYYINILGDVAGTWFYKWQGIGTVDVTSSDLSFYVRASQFLPEP